jgi:hypothetical protein
MAQAYELIQTYTLTTSAANVNFASIPQNYTDLFIVVSARTSRASNGDYFYIWLNDWGPDYAKSLWGYGTTVTSATATNDIGIVTGSTATTSTFSTNTAYVPNYTNSSNKIVSLENSAEDNATSSNGNSIGTFIWTDTRGPGGNPITSVKIVSRFSNFVSGSTFSLYGIGGARATGGTITADSNYTYHTFTSSGTFTTFENIKGTEVLVVAGGGGGGSDGAGGAGAGGVVYGTRQNISAGMSYSVIVGSGGSGQVHNGATSTNGSDSLFSSLAAIGGAKCDGGAGDPGGSGSGGSGRNNAAGGSSTQTTSGLNFIGYGNAGGNSRVSSTGATAGGGGGGAGAAGTSAPDTAAGAGGIGTSLFSTWGLATSTGQSSGGIYYYAGGGGGGSDTYAGASGGLGGGGAGAALSVGPATNGTANTGGGGGGGTGAGNRNGGNGGSGLVIIRYPN